MIYWSPTTSFEAAACLSALAAWDTQGTSKAADDVLKSFAEVGIVCSLNWRRGEDMKAVTKTDIYKLPQ